ncbi:hypothetical protein ES703_118065 [subsurface metagenome]
MKLCLNCGKPIPKIKYDTLGRKNTRTSNYCNNNKKCRNAYLRKRNPKKYHDYMQKYYLDHPEKFKRRDRMLYESKIVGVIGLNENKSLHFMITVRNYVDKFAQIRIYVESTRYTGYTKGGIILSRNQLQKLRDILSNNRDMAEYNREMGVIGNGRDSKIIIRGIKDKYTKFEPMIDVREYIGNKSYEGWTRNGFRIRIDDVGEIVQCLDKMESELKEEYEYKRVKMENSEIISELHDEFD